MKTKLQILALGAVAMMLLASCSVHRDRERIETAETLLYSNRDSADLLIRQVERPERLDDEILVRDLRPARQLHAVAQRGFDDMLGSGLFPQTMGGNSSQINQIKRNPELKHR